MDDGAASRVVGDERPCHRSLERAPAASDGVEDALAFVSGHATNVSAIATPVERRDLILMDQPSHNSITEGAKLSGAQRLVVPHNDLDWLEDRLAEVRGEHRHVLIAVEGLYSMDGHSTDLARLVEIKRQHDAWLMVDEAQGVDLRAVEISMGTLSKSLSACGGYIAGSRALTGLLRYNAPGFVYSVGLVAPLAAAAALAIIHREPERIARLAGNGRRFLERARAAGLDNGVSQGLAVTPVILGASLRAALTSHLLFEAGVSVPPIIYPAVPEKLVRLRFFLISEHSEAQIDRAIETLVDLLPETDRRITALRG